MNDLKIANRGCCIRVDDGDEDFRPTKVLLERPRLLDMSHLSHSDAFCVTIAASRNVGYWLCSR